MNKTIHIINAMQIGGVEIGVLSLLKSKINQDYKVIAIRGCDKDLYQSLTPDEQSRLYVCSGYLSALSLLIKLKPKTIISSLWRSHFVSLMLKMIAPKTKRIHFIHSARFAHHIDNIITRVSIFMASEVLCDSEQSQKWLNSFTRNKKATVLPMNISFSNKKKNISFDPVNFVFVGRFSAIKNLLKSIEFVKYLNAYGKVSTFDLYGRDEGELKLLKNYVEKNQLSDFVKFHSTLLPTEIEAEMRKYNYYLQSSLAEGMAISVYQAIKNGLLPVVTPVGEIKNYTKNGVNAFYLDKEDIEKSAKEFHALIINKNIETFQVGRIINKDNYLEFDAGFFSVMENTRTKF